MDKITRDFYQIKYIFWVISLASLWLSPLSVLGAKSMTVWDNDHSVHHLKKIYIDNPANLINDKNTEHLYRNQNNETLESEDFDNSLRFSNVHIDEKGAGHSRYDQYYKDIPVWGRQLIFHHDPKSNDTTRLVTGILSTDIKNDIKTTETKYTKEHIIQYIKEEFQNHQPGGPWKFTTPRAQMVIYLPPKHEEEALAKLAYKVSFFATSTINTKNKQKPYFIVDANDKTIYQYWNDLKTKVTNTGIGIGGNIKGKKTHYTYGTIPSLDNWPTLNNFDVTPLDDNYYALANDYIQVASLGDQPMDDEGIVYTDQEKLYPTFSYSGPYNLYDGGESINNGAYSINNDVMYAASNMIKMMTEYGFINPLGKPGTITRLYTHVTDLENAYAIKGNKSEQGSWHQQAIIGSGGDSFYPLASADIIAHELGHIFTDNHSNLIYDGQSGGINEAFSDMVGIAIVDYINKSNPWYINTWTIGQMVTKDDGHLRGLPLRYMDEPMKDSSNYCPKYFPKYGKRLCSISHAGDYYRGIDVHYSSGVYNKAFYLLSTALGSVKTAFIIFAKANAAYWVRNSDYNHASCGVIKAANEVCGQDCENKTRESFAAVGVYCPAH